MRKLYWFSWCFSLWRKFGHFCQYMNVYCFQNRFQVFECPKIFFDWSISTPEKMVPTFRVFLELYFSMSWDSKTDFLQKTSCSDVAHCKTIHLYAEHSYQLSQISYLGIIEERFFKKIHNRGYPEITAVYCPDRHFCGFDLEPADTKSAKTSTDLLACKVFAWSQNLCKTVADELKRACYVWFQWYVQKLTKIIVEEEV